MSNITVLPTSVLGTASLGTGFSVLINTVPISGAVITFSSVKDSTTVTVTHVNHGALAGDFVTFTNVDLTSELSSLVTLLEKEHEVTSVTNANVYTITLTSNPLSTLTDSGLIEAEYQLNRGSTTQLLGSGWGAGTWGADGWGLASSEQISTTTGLRIYSQDNFGEDLILCPRGGELFFWRENDGLSTRAFAKKQASYSY